MGLSEEEKKQFQKDYKEATEQSGEKMKESDIFLSLFTENHIKDPLCMTQLGIAICLDKPIYLLFEPGAKIPRHLMRIASGWEQSKNDSPQAIKEAADRLLKRAFANEEKET